MFTGEISGSLFVSGQHCSGPHRDQRRFPNSSRAGVQTGAVPSFEPISTLESEDVFILELSFHPLCI